MHETVFAARIIKEAKKHGDVEAITVEVGDLAHVPASDLAETLRQMAGADGWNVDVVEKKSIQNIYPISFITSFHIT